MHPNPATARLLSSFARADGGATSIEYSLVAALFALACIGGYGAFAESFGALFDGVSATVDAQLKQ